MSSHHKMIQKMAEQLETWDYELDRLQHRLGELEGELESDVKQNLEELKLKKDGLRARLAALGSAAESSADELLEGVEIAKLILEESFSEAKNKLAAVLKK